MTVRELVSFFIDENNQRFVIYDVDEGEEVFEGYGNDIPDELLICYVSSVDNILHDSATVTINI